MDVKRAYRKIDTAPVIHRRLDTSFRNADFPSMSCHKGQGAFVKVNNM